MPFHQIIHEDLGCASYLIASAGEAVVVDPRWEVEEYVRLAADAGARIGHVLETHCHADHVSGRRRLVQLTGAVAYVPADPSRPEAPGLRDGDLLRAGDVVIRVIGTPGHRPEHVAFLVFEPGRPAAPRRLLSGDSLLIGQLARPDLAVDPVDGARALWDTVRRLTALDESVELWPGHVGASLCGSGALGEHTSSTIGAELRSDPALAIPDIETFVRRLSARAPARPPRVERVVALNCHGASHPGPVRELDPSGLAAFVSGGACVLDVRNPGRFDAGHVRGALNLPIGGRGLGTRAGWATAPDEPVVVVASTREEAVEVSSLLYAAGVVTVAGITVADLAGWIDAGVAVARSRALAPRDVSELLDADAIELVDVRDRGEWATGHVPGSRHLPLDELGDGRGSVVPARRPLAVACAGGRRAALAASVLRRNGCPEVYRVTGGIENLAEHGTALVRPEWRAVSKL